MNRNHLSKIFDKYQTPISTVRHMPLIKTGTKFLPAAISLTPKKMTAAAPLTKVSVKNNTVMNLNFTVLDHKKTIMQIINSSQSIWFAAANINSEYEWYLQKSMIRNIYDMYYQFTDFVRKRDRFSALNNIYGLYHNSDRQIEHFGNLIFQKFMSYLSRQTVYEKMNYIYPQLLLKKEDAPNNNQQPVIESSFTENQIQVQKKIEVENPGDRTNIHSTIYNYTNIENVMERVYKKIEEKLRYERLKKGY